MQDFRLSTFNQIETLIAKEAKMKTMKIWRKSRLSERHANPFANGRTRAIYTIAFAMLAALSLVSCSSDEPDGKWDPMVWEAKVQKTEGVYTVPANGTELTFSCQNYSFPWIENAVSNGEYYYPPREANDYHTISADWFKAEISGNKLTVVFEANETAEERLLQLTVTAGDIFYTLNFMQLANHTVQFLPEA